MVKKAKDFWDKFLDYIGLNENIKHTADTPTYPETKTFKEYNKPTTKVINIHKNNKYRFVVKQPKIFNEVTEVSDQLKGRNPVILSLVKMEPDTARRFIDFLSGVVYALEGEIKRIEQGIFLIVPSNVDVSWELEEKLKKEHFPLKD